MKKSLIIGIDLSFNSTGITIKEFLGEVPLNISFHRLIFDDESNKFKKYIPKPILNVNQSTYKLPTNISVNDIILDDSDFYSESQAKVTLKAMVCTKRISEIIYKKIIDINKDSNIDLYINIEGFIAPSIQGINQFNTLAGLIMLQGMLRADLIKLKLLPAINIDNFKLFITSPSDLKKWFTGNGSADKQEMLTNFLTVYNGKILLPDTTSLDNINDVIDSFALSLNCVAKVKKLTEVKKKPIKKKKKKKAPAFDILKNSINL